MLQGEDLATLEYVHTKLLHSKIYKLVTQEKDKVTAHGCILYQVVTKVYNCFERKILILKGSSSQDIKV